MLALAHKINRKFQADGAMRHPNELVDVTKYSNLKLLIDQGFISIIPPVENPHECNCGKKWVSEDKVSIHNCKEVEVVEEEEVKKPVARTELKRPAIATGRR